ncbi:MAG: glycosyltransferase family 2 protein [Rhodospirillales bacterium]|nr:glycosyltransferase family 2 protein [Rhodospirillales bacterium]
MAERKKASAVVKRPAPGDGLISVVLSFRNEAEVLPELIRRLDAVLSKDPDDYELVFVNDDSTDGSLEVLTAARANNRRIKIVNMSRRFGQPECLMAGVAHAEGDAVIYMDADLQDPPEVIPDMLAKWRDGAEVVYTVRTHREGENPLKMWLTRLAYRAINVSSEIDMPVNAGDFRLLSRVVRDRLLDLAEHDPYARGLVPWIGYRQEPVHYERAARVAGKAHFSLFNSLTPYKTFISGFTSFSMAPIFLIFLIGGGVALISLVGLALALVVAAVSAAWILFLLFLWGSLLCALGCIGIYVGRTYKDVRGRPRYIVKDKIGFDD